jgi:DNA-binding MarR family transcriptional regulator
VPPRERLTLSAYRLAHLFKRVRRQLQSRIREHLEPAGISLPTVQIIKRMAAGGSPSQLELAQDIELEPAALCRLVTELEEQRLVVRRRDPEDKRRVLVSPTRDGLALLTRTQPLVLAGINATVSRLTAAEQAQLCRLLEKLADGDGATEARLPETAARDDDDARSPLRARTRHRAAGRR